MCDTCISANEPYKSAKKACIYTKKRLTYLPKGPAHLQKSPAYPQKKDSYISATETGVNFFEEQDKGLGKRALQKRPIHLQKSPTYQQKRPTKKPYISTNRPIKKGLEIHKKNVAEERDKGFGKTAQQKRHKCPQKSPTIPLDETHVKTCTVVGYGDSNENLKTCKLRGLQ